MFDSNTLDGCILSGARSVGPMRQIREDVSGVEVELVRPFQAARP